MQTRLTALVPVLAIATAASAQNAFVNWESPHVNPLDLTADGTTLLAVNTADNRLEVFDVDDERGTVTSLGAIPVGLDPVSVRARTATEAWVVNHVSDTVSVVDLTTFNVIATLPTGDEPTDVVFAGAVQRAFVSVSQLNQVVVFDPADLLADPVVIDIEGEDPRALATDGAVVYAAIFESGNLTTILGVEDVNNGANPYPGDPNPPPNSGAGFDPPLAGGLPAAPEVGLIVRKDESSDWLDDNGGNWSPLVGWDLHDHDVAMIDAGTLAVSYVSGLMNLNMNLSVTPSGAVTVIGTEAINEIRFEPNVNGIFGRVVGATFDPPLSPPTTVDLNPHLDYTTTSVPQGTRDLSIGDPRGLDWNAAGDRVYIAGMGSNNLVAFDAALGRVGLAEVGEGPTGVRVHDDAGLVFVLDKFEGAISVVDTGSLSEIDRVPFHDPTPEVIEAGRPHLYDTHETSGLGHLSCASCHIDGRMDQLAWDLGDPSGEVMPFDQICQGGIPGFCEDFHPMKGPMTTQTLVGIIGTEPLHWRGDRDELSDFNGAFESLMGDDEQLTPAEMDEFTAFVATLTTPPNPFRNMNNAPVGGLPNGGNAATGQNLFMNVSFEGGVITCNFCHSVPSGTNGQVTPAIALQESQSFKVPQLRNMHEKTGFSRSSSSNSRGFGFLHDGSIESLFTFLQFDGFDFINDQQRRDVEAFMLSFATDTHAGIGTQATIGGVGPDQTETRDFMLLVSADAAVGLVAKGVVDGEPRGYYHLGGGVLQSDRADETTSVAVLDAFAGMGGEITYTLVPSESEVRIGVDRDGDGHFDGDELDRCSDPADPDSVPDEDGCGNVPGDVDGDGIVNVSDLVAVILAWGTCPDLPDPCPADLDGDGEVGVSDLIEVVLNWS